MIRIEDNDLPITAAQKIITGKREAEKSSIDNALSVFGFGPRDMFDIDEIREIAIYLMMFYMDHKEEEG